MEMIKCWLPLLWGAVLHDMQLSSTCYSGKITFVAIKLKWGGTKGHLPPISNNSPSTRIPLRFGQLGKLHGLYLDCVLDDLRPWALVDTVSLVCPGTLPGSEGPKPQG